MTDLHAPLWILSIPAHTAADAETLTARIIELCDCAPVELETPGQAHRWLEMYVEEELTALLYRDALRREFPDLPVEVRPCPHQDWTTFWRHHFRIREIGRRLRIVPEWLRDEAPAGGDRVNLLVNPGLSFGTGDHFTTRYCLERIDQLVAEGLLPERMLDAGCGSAILAIAARKLGWDNILAVDHDPTAVRQAAENLDLNGIHSGITLGVMDLTREWPQGPFPVVFANLYGGLLMELAPQLLRVCSGTLILSGIRVIEAEAVASVFAALGAKECASDADHEWCGFRFECK